MSCSGDVVRSGHPPSDTGDGEPAVAAQPGLALHDAGAVDVPEGGAPLGGNGSRVGLVGGHRSRPTRHARRAAASRRRRRRPSDSAGHRRRGRPRSRSARTLGRLGGVDVPADPDRGVDGPGQVLGEVQLDERAGPVELERVLRGRRRPEHELRAADEQDPAELARPGRQGVPVADPVADPEGVGDAVGRVGLERVVGGDGGGDVGVGDVGELARPRRVVHEDRPRPALDPEHGRAAAREVRRQRGDDAVEDLGEVGVVAERRPRCPLRE